MNQGSINMRYRVLKVLGRSRMSVVLKVWDVPSHKILALKASRLYGRSYSEEVLAREFFLLSRQRHERIVRALNFDIAAQGGALPPGTLYFTMEYMKGMTLDRMRGRDLHDIEEVLMQILSALQAVHAQGIVYGDVKPHNIMRLEAPGGMTAVKLFDFGLSQREGEQRDSKEVSGTLMYMAPEMFQGGKIDRRADLYSLGALLYEMTTGYPPFPGKDALSVAYGHLLEMPVNPASLNPVLPEKFRVLISKLLQKEPDRRFQSVEEILSFMENHAEGPANTRSFNLFEKRTIENRKKPEEVRC